MAISYPLTIPSTPGFRVFNMLHDVGTAKASNPFTGQTQVQEYAKKKFLIEAQLPPMERSTAEAWRAFLAKLSGPKGTFLIGDPLAKQPRGVATGTPLVNGASQTGQSLITDGWTPSTTGILLAGDYIQIGQRLYVILIDADSDGSGNATLDIFPNLRESPADNETIYTINTTGLFRLSRATVTVSGTDEERVFDIGFSAEEAI